MNLFIFPREIGEINKWGGGVKIRCEGSPRLTKNINVPPFILNLRAMEQSHILHILMISYMFAFYFSDIIVVCVQYQFAIYAPFTHTRI